MNKFLTFFKNLKDKILDIIFPLNTKCIFCEDEIVDFDQKPYCDRCEKFAFNSGNKCVKCDTQIKSENIICDHCKSHKRFFEKCYCPLNYKDSVRSSILRFKDSNAKYLAKSYAKLISLYIKNENLNFDIVTFVPSHKNAVKRRGYNPAKLIAEELALLENKPCIETLIKINKTPPQKNLSYQERAKNLENSMIITNAKAIKNKTLLLIDDVVTTCATVDHCSKLLKPYASKIYVAAVARNHLKKENED